MQIKMFITAMPIIAKNYKQLKCPKRKTNCGIVIQRTTTTQGKNKELGVTCVSMDKSQMPNLNQKANCRKKHTEMAFL